MTQQFKVLFCSLLTGAALWLAPAAKADEWNKRTVMTFNAPVEIPGKVLEAGTYVFKLYNSQSDRTIVQIYTADEKQLVATIMGIPDYRLDTPEKTIVAFDERPAGSPEAIHSWFYPGDNYGVEFVYNQPKQLTPTHENPTLVTAAPAPVPAPVEVAAAPEAAPAPAQPVPVIVEEREEVVVVAQETAVATTPDPEPTELPKTAGNFAMIPLAGLALLAGGFTAVRFAAKQS
jgi:hypothetical protein